MKLKINIAFLSYQIGKNPKIWQYTVSETVRKWLPLYSAGRNPAPPVPIKVHLSVSNKIIDTFIYWLSSSMSRSLSPRYTGVCMCACMLSLQPCPTLCDPMDCSVLPGFSIHGIFQAGILEWVAMYSSKGSSQPRDWTHGSCVFCITDGFFTSKPLGKPQVHLYKYKIILVKANLIPCGYYLWLQKDCTEANFPAVGNSLIKLWHGHTEYYAAVKNWAKASVCWYEEIIKIYKVRKTRCRILLHIV